MSLEKALSALCQEPYCFTPRQIRDMTPYQVKHLIFRKADRPDDTPDGLLAPLLPGASALEAEKQLYWEVHKRRNVPEAEIAAGWAKLKGLPIGETVAPDNAQAVVNPFSKEAEEAFRREFGM